MFSGKLFEGIHSGTNFLVTNVAVSIKCIIKNVHTLL